MDEVPTTRREMPYGTPEMALEMERLLRDSNLRQRKIWAMAEYEEGILSFGVNWTEAYSVLLKEVQALN